MRTMKCGPLVIDLIVRILLALVYCLLEVATPFHRTIGHEELMLYSNPPSSDTISTPVLLANPSYVYGQQITAIGVPVAFLVVHTVVCGDRYDLTQALLGLSLAAELTGIIINTLKLCVGRPRPDFYYRCYPEGWRQELLSSDFQCYGNPDTIEQGLKSFPSGHAGWMFSCFGFLSLYLSGKLHCFHPLGRGQAWRLCVVAAPLLAAAVVGVSRIQDHKHHWEDVVIGALIGIAITLVCYHQYYPSPLAAKCGSPHPPLLQPHLPSHAPPLTSARGDRMDSSLQKNSDIETV